MRVNRRGLVIGAVAGGGLLVAWSLIPRRYALPLAPAPGETAFTRTRGASSTVISGRISRGTPHIYRVRARAGQEMAVVLNTGDETSFTVSGWNSGILEGADGVRQTVVELPETGEYVLQIGTDVTDDYSLEITIN
jgi:hypothetical protein